SPACDQLDGTASVSAWQRTDPPDRGLQRGGMDRRPAHLLGGFRCGGPRACEFRQGFPRRRGGAVSGDQVGAVGEFRESSEFNRESKTNLPISAVAPCWLNWCGRSR